MRAMVRDLGLPFKEYASISATYTGNGTTLATQVPSLIGRMLRWRSSVLR